MGDVPCHGADKDMGDVLQYDIVLDVDVLFVLPYMVMLLSSLLSGM